MQIKINKDGYVDGWYITDADREIVITEKQYEKISFTPAYHAWKYIEEDDDFVLELLYTDDVLRRMREDECFKILDNRSQIWYELLSNEQKEELKEWYNNWLKITETKVIPDKPIWLK